MRLFVPKLALHFHVVLNLLGRRLAHDPVDDRPDEGQQDDEEHPARGWPSAEVTAEQVCRTLAWVCRGYLRRRRRTDETACLVDILAYHQQRNAAARKSRQKRPRRLRRFTAL